MAVRLCLISRVVVLMIPLCSIEIPDLFDTRCQLVPYTLQNLHKPFSDLPFFRCRVENDRLVLRPDVWSLSSHLCRIVDLKEEPCQCLVIGDFGIVEDCHSLHMSGLSHTHVPVGGKLHGTAGVSRYDIEDSRQAFEHALDSPETATGEHSNRGPLIIT